jgi:O-antigen/teichoic acid export membrane protein
VNGAPLLVIAAGTGSATSTSKAAAVVFAATMLVRVPVFLFSGVAGSILPNLTRLNAAEDHGLFTRTVKRVCLLFAVATLVIVLVAAVLGPTAMTILYGPAYSASAGDLALLGFAAGCYLASATVSQALLALARTGTAAVVWASSAALFVGVYVLAGGTELHRIALATALATLLNALLLAVIFARRARRA